MKESEGGYGIVSVINHWLAAIVVLTMLGLGLVFSGMERGPEKAALMKLHISIGGTALLFLLFRIVWRAAQGFPPFLTLAKWERKLAGFTHRALLTTIGLLLLTGPLIVWSGGNPISLFGVVTLPSPMEKNREFHEVLETLHFIAGKPLLLSLLALHLLGTLKHLIFDRGRMRLRMFHITSRAPEKI